MSWLSKRTSFQNSRKALTIYWCRSLTEWLCSTLKPTAFKKKPQNWPPQRSSRKNNGRHLRTEWARQREIFRKHVFNQDFPPRIGIELQKPNILRRRLDGTLNNINFPIIHPHQLLATLRRPRSSLSKDEERSRPQDLSDLQCAEDSLPKQRVSRPHNPGHLSRPEDRPAIFREQLHDKIDADNHKGNDVSSQLYPDSVPSAAWKTAGGNPLVRWIHSKFV